MSAAEAETEADAATLRTTVAEFDTWLAGIQSTVEECRIDISEAGLGVQAVDPCNVMVVETLLGNGALEEYAPSAGPDAAGVHIERLRGVLDAWDDGAWLDVEIEDSSIGLCATPVGQVVGFAESIIKPEIIRDPPDWETVDAIDYDYTARIVETSTFRAAVETAGQVADACALYPDGDALRIEAEGDTSTATAYISSCDPVAGESAVADGAHYPTSYLGDICGALELLGDPELVLSWSDQAPLRVRATDSKQGWLSHDGIRWAIAPRITNTGGGDE